jgi:hypothetical protein
MALNSNCISSTEFSWLNVDIKLLPCKHTFDHLPLHLHTTIWACRMIDCNVISKNLTLLFFLATITCKVHCTKNMRIISQCSLYNNQQRVIRVVRTLKWRTGHSVALCCESATNIRLITSYCDVGTYSTATFITWEGNHYNVWLQASAAL